MKNSEFGGLRTSCIDEILLPHLCIVCFITFLAIYQGKFGFGEFQQKLGLRSDPPPLLGQKPKFLWKSILMAALRKDLFWDLKLVWQNPKTRFLAIFLYFFALYWTFFHKINSRAADHNIYHWITWSVCGQNYDKKCLCMINLWSKYGQFIFQFVRFGRSMLTNSGL